MNKLYRKIAAIVIIFIFFITSVIPATAKLTRYDKSQFSIDDDESLKEKNFDLKMKFLMKLGNYPSLSACIIKNDSVVWSKAYGYSNVYQRKKASTDTIYLLSSVTKPVTATALLQLYEKGLFDLDEDVNNYLPFSLRHPKYPYVNITFRMLLTHRSGTFDYHLLTKDGRKDLLKSFPFPEDLYPFIKEILVPGGKMYHQDTWLDHAPGTKAAYSNIGYAVIAYLVEKIANQPMEEYCQENIFEPLQMYNTSFHPDGFDRDRIAVPYIKHGGVYIPLPHYDCNCLAPVYGLRTTVEDLSHFLIVHMNGGRYKDIRVLNESTVELMHTTLYPETLYNSLPYKYGLGWFSTERIGERIEGHGGDGPGALCNMMMNSSENIGCIVLSNQQNFFALTRIGGFISFLKSEIRWLIVKVLLQNAEFF